MYGWLKKCNRWADPTKAFATSKLRWFELYVGGILCYFRQPPSSLNKVPLGTVKLGDHITCDHSSVTQIDLISSQHTYSLFAPTTEISGMKLLCVAFVDVEEV
eukprot:m.245608 g.245608  ORF g.245608 m.245608 type:complete len:103 (-) comp33837_c5_seq3:484-792(-)